MADSRHEGSRWRRLLGTLLFDASIAVAVLGVARAVFGVAIYLGPGPTIPLGAGGPWSAFALAAVLFVTAASIRPGYRSSKSPTDRTLGEPQGSDVGALGAGPADVGAPVLQRTPLPHERSGD